MGIVRIWFKILIVVWSIYLPVEAVIYLFSNNSVGEAKSAKIYKILSAQMRSVYDTKSDIADREARARQLISLSGGDGDGSIYSALKRRDTVSTLSIDTYETVRGSDGHLDNIRTQFQYKTLPVNIFTFVRSNRSFFHPLDLEVAGICLAILSDPIHPIQTDDPLQIGNFLTDVASSGNDIRYLDRIVATRGQGAGTNPNLCSMRR